MPGWVEGRLISGVGSSEGELEELFKHASGLLGDEKAKIAFEVRTIQRERGEGSRLLDEISLKAEDLRRKRRKRSAILSVSRAGAILMLFLALGLLQHDLLLYLFFVFVGCIVLGVSTFLERAD